VTGALRLRQVLAREVIARCGTRRQPPSHSLVNEHQGSSQEDEAIFASLQQERRPPGEIPMGDRTYAVIN
jgi:hypothetical protein